MNSILKSFFYRTFKTKGFWVQFAILGALGLFVGIILVSIARGFYNSYQAADEEFERAIYLAEYEAMSFHDLSLVAINGGVLSTSASLPHIPLCIITILFSIRFHAEYSSGSMRNYIVSGYSRQQAYRSLFIGFLVYCSALYASFALSFIAVLGVGQLHPGFADASVVGQYFACIFLSFLCYIAYYAFAFFINAALGGRGFAGPLCLMIYVAFSLVLVISQTLFVLTSTQILFESNFDEQALKDSADALRVLCTFTPAGQAAILSSGDLSTPAISLASLYSDEGLLIDDYTIFNLIVILVENAGLGVGSFFLGQTIIGHRDLK